MIDHQDVAGHISDVWAKLAAPIPAHAKSWRQDGRPVARNGEYFARFVVYIEAGVVRERLDSVAPGEWSLTLELLPPSPGGDADTICAFKARLQILGVVREDVGFGKDYKQASTDAFKRAAVRFGIGHELYEYEQNWVRMDGDGKYAKPLEDPGDAYERRMARKSGDESHLAASPEREPEAPRRAPAAAPAPATGDVPPCPKCGGNMYDNRAENAQRLANGQKQRPDFKCKDRSCDGCIWPPKEGRRAKASAHAVNHSEADANFYGGAEDEIPF